jgi:hypothetical protein
MAEGIVAEVVDPDGRDVVLSEARWDHVTAGHPELDPFQSAVLEAVRAPSQRLTPGRTPGEEWFYKAEAGPSRWLKVVVRYDATGSGSIVTAFARRSLP